MSDQIPPLRRTGNDSFGRAAIIPRPWTPPGAWSVIRELCSFEGRLAGHRRRAAGRELARRRACATSGGAPRSSPPTSTRSTALVHAAHCALGFAGSLVADRPARGRLRARARDRGLDVPRPQLPPLPGAPAVLPPRLAERRLPRQAPRRPRARSSSAPTTTPPAPARFFNSEASRARRAARRPPPGPLGPFRILFWSLALLLPILGARMAGFDSSWLSLLQLIPTLVLLVGVFLLIDIALSRGRPRRQRQRLRGRGRALARRASSTPTRPPNLDVWVLLTGAEECLQEGMRAFVRAHRDEPRPRRPPTSSTSTRSVTAGPLRDRRRAGSISYRHGPAAGGALRRRSRPPTARTRTATRRGRCVHGSPATRCRPRSRASRRRRSPAATT